MAQVTMFAKTGVAFKTNATTKASRRSAVAVRAGPYDAELIETAVSRKRNIRNAWCTQGDLLA